jgi:hypothetical protein
MYRNGYAKIQHRIKSFSITFTILRSYLASEEQERLKPKNKCFKYLFRSNLLHCLHILLHLCPSKHVLGNYQRHLQRCQGGGPADQVPPDSFVDPDPHQIER